jgi:hypothetical protein
MTQGMNKRMTGNDKQGKTAGNENDRQPSIQVFTALLKAIKAFLII